MTDEETKTAQEEAAEVRKALGIGTPLETRIAKLRANKYQYASAGTPRC